MHCCMQKDLKAGFLHFPHFVGFNIRSMRPPAPLFRRFNRIYSSYASFPSLDGISRTTKGSVNPMEVKVSCSDRSLTLSIFALIIRASCAIYHAMLHYIFSFMRYYLMKKITVIFAFIIQLIYEVGLTREYSSRNYIA